jgi:hypothetical protein
MRRRRPRALLMLGLLAGGVLAPGGGRCDTAQFQMWIDYNPTWKLGERLSLFGDAGLRRNDSDPHWWRYVLRPSVGYDLGRWQVAGGVGNFYTQLWDIADIYELRPWQGAQVFWPRSKIRLGHLFRLEERIFFDTDDRNSLFRLRFRYQLGTRLAWTDPQERRGWSSPVSLEVFFQFDDRAEERFGEQLRLTAGIERAFSPELKLRLDVLWQKVERLFDIYSDNEIDFRLRVFHNF